MTQTTDNKSGFKLHLGLKEFLQLVIIIAALVAGWSMIGTNTDNLEALTPMVNKDHVKLVLMEQEFEGIKGDVSEMRADYKMMATSQQAMKIDIEGLKTNSDSILHELSLVWYSMLESIFKKISPR